MKKIFLICFLIIVRLVNAQEVLTISEALKLTLESNHNIKIASLDTIKISNEASYGNAGLLPKIYVNNAIDLSSNNADIDLAYPNENGSMDIIPLSATKAQSKTLKASINVSYTLFDGFGAFHRLKLLKNKSEMSKLQSIYILESTLLDVAKLYLKVATYQVNLNLAQEQLNISNDRLKRLEVKYKYGSSNKTNVLNALVAVKTDSSELRQSQLKYKIAKSKLISLIGMDSMPNFIVTEDVVFNVLQSKDSLRSQVAKNNIHLRMAEKGLVLSKRQIEVTKAERFPKLIFNGGYNYLEQDNDIGQLLYQQLDGWSVGLSLKVNLFDGNRINKKIENSKIQFEQQSLKLNQEKLFIISEFEIIYEEYKQAQEDLKIELSNLKTFEQNLRKSDLDYQNGQITSNQVREAQLELLASKLRITRATYLVKQKEIELLQITGNMLINKMN